MEYPEEFDENDRILRDTILQPLLSCQEQEEKFSSRERSATGSFNDEFGMDSLRNRRQEENEFEKQTGISWFIMHSWFNKKRQKVIRLHLSRCIAKFLKPEVLLNYEEYKDFT
ncbi:hypothetical protein L5515_017224 [Caenorhabditis briggsae]|uniref:Uncharacterized protein n=1 Tax=Caenorhabditis briggsae TaxID=6238 RepID=A0AAE9FGH0_CAEBR|nr:hypothetical protein L5515_017224 [Caenorhabditis briggsae]